MVRPVSYGPDHRWSSGELPDVDDHGRRTRPRVLLRGDAVNALTVSDGRVLISAVGLRQVIDLRTAAERAEHFPTSSGVRVTFLVGPPGRPRGDE
jgi:hypothetical protein